jgi:release factor glutamine methyltransferase
MTFEAYLKQGEERLRRGPHPERARRDAEFLLVRVLGRSRAWLLAHGNDVVDVERCDQCAAWLERRAAGEPIQYIVGEAEFYGMPFRVTPDVLIPRPETEHLVEKVIELAGGIAELRIADVGTGSGAIAVALAKHLPQARITATDVSYRAIGVAHENAGRNEVAARIGFLRCDLLAANLRFDIVASNPPYVPESDRESIAVEVRDYEPGVALFAGTDGLDVIRRLIPQAFAALVPGGWLLMEIGHGQSPVVSALLGEAGFAEIEFVPDLQGIPRVAVGRKPE